MPRSAFPVPVNRDVSCRITAHREGTQIAHLVPASEQIWFADNNMSRYAMHLRASPIDSGRNSILLRSDLHTLFDAKKFAFVPKRAGVNAERLSFAVHAFVNEVDSEIVQLYHNVVLQPLSELALEFLFARFAWTIFPLVSEFLARGRERVLRVRNKDEYSTETFSAAQCMGMVKQSRSRSASPKKRKPASEPDAEEILDEDLGFEEGRGRKRRRSSSPLWPWESSISTKASFMPASATESAETDLGRKSPCYRCDETLNS